MMYPWLDIWELLEVRTAFCRGITGQEFSLIQQTTLDHVRYAIKSNSKCPTKAKMISMPLIEQSFQQIAMDVVWPLPRTQGGNKFILIICDYATRYPEAFSLPSAEAPRVAKELIKLFSHARIPDEILTDQGTNFMHTMMEEISHLRHIKRIRTTPYHPQTDGLVEKV